MYCRATIGSKGKIK